MKRLSLSQRRRDQGRVRDLAKAAVGTLAGRLGHADVTMLQNHYAAFVESADQEAANTIQDVFDRMVAASRAERSG